MQMQVNVYEAKTQLSKLLQQVEGGDEIIIARRGKPVARLVPVQRAPVRRVPGVGSRSQPRWRPANCGHRVTLLCRSRSRR